MCSALIEIQVFTRPFVPAKNALGRHEFRDQHVRAAFLAELAEDFVRHSRHGREIKRETRKP
jgi:hypothetical protein